ncbi:peptide chain release factor N(5)-glutamine methyltransferase [Candidatus Uhrbacteria bacterium]|nr:peptide chain release factor N(5)-glutamine methyltransferase [Candidatus Uhrbacteria bacterium]
MLLQEALRRAYRQLQKAGVDAPLLDADLLMRRVLGVPGEKLLGHPDLPVTPQLRRRFFALVGRRARREPLAYILGHKEFYGLDFLVNRAVLIPRPETETLVEAIFDEERKQKIKNRKQLIVEVGTGSGIVAITLAKYLPKATIYATDTSAAALSVAKKNAARHQAAVIFKKGNLLSPFKKTTSYQLPITSYLIIAANLPYVPTREWKTLQPEIRKYEPRGAVDGGPDGLKYYRQLILQLQKLLITSYRLPVTIFLEFDPEETVALRNLVKKSFPAAKMEIKKDLAGRNRVFIATLPFKIGAP